MLKRNLFILVLILLVVFLIFPENSLALEYDEIKLKELGKRLTLSRNSVQELVHSLISVFHKEFVDMMSIRQLSFPYPTKEEMAVPSVMKKAVQIQALNYLLTDAPFQVTWGIVNNSVKIVRLLLAEDISTILGELEKESAKKATEYGINFLLEKEIRIAPGVISFEYKTTKENKRLAILQYIMIYKPVGGNRGEILIRFYSPSPLEPPKNEGSVMLTIGTYTELKSDLPPFIVDVRGSVENFKWVNNPTVAINFPPNVPDLGIKPLGFWERNVLKPIVTKIKDVEVIITKISGNKPLKVAGNLTGKLTSFLGNVWDTIKSKVLQKVNLSGGARIGETIIEIIPRTKEEKQEIIQRLKTTATEQGERPDGLGQKIGQKQSFEQKTERSKELTSAGLAELQRQIDEATKMMAALSLHVQELIKVRGKDSQEELGDQETKKKDINDKEEFDRQKQQEQKEKLTQKQKSVCPVEVNSASAEDLEEIIGVGPKIAQRIIAARPFYSLSELEIKVKGIGPVTLQKIREQNCAYVSAPSGGPSLTSDAKEEQQEQQEQQEQEEQEEQEQQKEEEQQKKEEEQRQETQTQTQAQAQEQVEVEAKNILLNEFFEDWSNNATPTNWIWKNTLKRIGQDSTDPLRGSYNVWLQPIASHNVLQQTIDTTPNTTYYAEIWAKGTDKVRIRLGIIGPGASYGEYSELENNEWTRISYSRTLGDVASATLAISVLESENEQRPRVYIGAAWLSTSTPPSSWPKGKPPNKVENFTLDSQNSYSNKAVLSWATGTDPDTASEDLAYKIYYSTSTQGYLTEDDLDNPAIQAATTTQTTITLSGLEFNSTYYFGIKAYDPQNNLSALATTTSYKTATLGVIATGFSANLNRANNGRKIVRTSNGTFYTVYERSVSGHYDCGLIKDCKVYLASSTNNGVNWTETEITSDKDQFNPSIAVDSQNNLHIAWQGIVSTSTSTKYQIRYTKYGGASFSEIENITANIDEDQIIPFIAVDHQDKIHLAWLGKTDVGDRIYYKFNSDGVWSGTEIVKEREPRFTAKSFIEHFSFAIDTQNTLHFSWFETIPTGWGSAIDYFRYLKGNSGNWGNYINLKTVDLQGYSSIGIDSDDNVHIVWTEPDQKAKRWFSVIQYLKCSARTGECGAIDTRNEEKTSNSAAFPSVAVNSDDNVYVVWKIGDIKPLSQIEYKNGKWRDVKTLIDAFDYAAFPNMLWSANSRPKSGYAFVFYQNTELKFYSSNDLTY